MLERLRYFILRALRNMRQWPLLCSAAILTMAVALATVASFFLVVVNIEQLAERWTREIQVVAYLEEPLEQSALAGLLEELEAFPEVASAIYVSPAEAMQRFSERLGEDAALLEGVSDGLLPASIELGLEVDARDAAGVDRVVRQLEERLAVDDLRYGQEWLENFNNFVAMLKFISLILGGFLLFAALFIVSNTIKLTLFARRDELEIMALVGATMRFIKVPFMLEGAIQGLLAGLLSLAFLGLSFVFIIGGSLKAFWLTPTGFSLQFLTWQQQLVLVGAGILLGTLGSLSSLRRFVRL